MSFRRAARTDANQTEIVEAFRDLGWSVLIVSQLKNCCDLFVSKNGHTFAIEVKDGSKPPSKQKLSEGELEFKNSWQGGYKLIACIADVDELNSIDFQINNSLYPCPKCGSPSMKDARVNPVKYECFNCSHVWTKNEKNRRGKSERTN